MPASSLCRLSYHPLATMASYNAEEVGKNDFVLLDDISMSAFMNNLQLRFKKAKIYTYIGEVVVSVNPYRPMNIYDRQYIQDYKGREMYEREPHIFALSDAVYRNMKRTGHNSCIVISGMETQRGGTTEDDNYNRGVLKWNIYKYFF